MIPGHIPPKTPEGIKPLLYEYAQFNHILIISYQLNWLGGYFQEESVAKHETLLQRYAPFPKIWAIRYNNWVKVQRILGVIPLLSLGGNGIICSNPTVHALTTTLLLLRSHVAACGLRCGSACKESACNAGDPGSSPGLGRSSGEGNGNSLQYSCLKNPMDRGAWWATVQGMANSQTWVPLKARLQPVAHRIDSTGPQGDLYCTRETNFSVWDCSRLMTKKKKKKRPQFSLFFYPHLCYMSLNFLSRSEIYFPTPGIQVGLMI